MLKTDVPKMAQAQRTDESKNTERSDKAKLLGKGRFILLIALLTAIIILLCIILTVIMTTNISPNYETQNNINNSCELHNKMFKSSEKIQGPYQMIYREKWAGRPPLYERPQNVPVKYVIISHTAGGECLTITDCSEQVRQIQQLHITAGSPDIGYNFLIGGDANIYVGRGWDNHNFHMALDTIGISFIGNYLYNKLSPEMIEATQQLLKDGVEKGKLDKDYILVGHNQTYSTLSPGENVYKQIKFWPHFSPEFVKEIH